MPFRFRPVVVDAALGLLVVTAILLASASARPAPTRTGWAPRII
jgi:hypothetical protein